MNSETDPKIIELLKQYTNQDISYYQAKQNLIKLGYKEEDIESAGDNYEYGTKPVPLDPTTALFAKDPEDTTAVAQDILKEQKKDREEQAIADGLAGQRSPDLQSDLKFQNNYLQDIGMSWWLWIAIEFVIVGLLYWLKLPTLLYSIIILPIIIVLAIKRA